MTNSYNSFLKPKIVFIHGLNNNIECFVPIMNQFRDLGYATEVIILPCHGENRNEVKNLQEANKLFAKKMEKINQSPYFVIAFSHGALYLQLWMQEQEENLPLKQVLLAPALYINYQKIISPLIRAMPRDSNIRSFSPAPFRKYDILSAWEYKILIDGLVQFDKSQGPKKVPTSIFIDPEDELVDAKALIKNHENVNLIERKYLKTPLGCHHILFYPEYFNPEDWKALYTKINNFLVAT